MNDARKTHWEQVYANRDEDETSWFQPRPEISLALLEHIGEPRNAAVIDVGGGASRLVDHLIDQGWNRLSVLDIAANALDRARQRLGEKAGKIQWLEADLLEVDPGDSYRIWHDRAVFHFLTAPEDRARYLQRLEASLEPGGHLIIATFAPEGPESCSGLPVQRYSPEQLSQTLGDKFQLQETVTEEHHTPTGKNQSFIYCRFRYLP
ncbi:class I SAM-dependent methyltransferase [Thiolapillus brandeum]|uniref:Methyltransferase type 12 n=1 Tax=Thiolapillus brandeum TaxID=1076588 RepID=A0A7U6GL25_9GAMM|nr:class I SAM-dependent methyltransferase [Thiolapillus brandeum]BAO45589.1 methyltransferase type 12 [Thiolapillus brandeum]